MKLEAVLAEHDCAVFYFPLQMAALNMRVSIELALINAEAARRRALLDAEWNEALFWSRLRNILFLFVLARFKNL